MAASGVHQSMQLSLAGKPDLPRFMLNRISGSAAIGTPTDERPDIPPEPTSSPNRPELTEGPLA